MSRGAVASAALILVAISVLSGDPVAAAGREPLAEDRSHTGAVTATSMHAAGCPAVRRTSKWTGVRVSVSVRGTCFSGMRLSYRIRQVRTTDGTGSYTTRLTGRVKGHAVRVAGLVQWGSSDSLLRMTVSGTKVTGFDGAGSPWARPDLDTVGFGLSGSNYYCNINEGGQGARSITMTTAPFGVSHVQGDPSPEQASGLPFAVCSALLEASHAYAHDMGD